jgi:hypothetical protein
MSKTPEEFWTLVVFGLMCGFAGMVLARK